MPIVLFAIDLALFAFFEQQVLCLLLVQFVVCSVTLSRVERAGWYEGALLFFLLLEVSFMHGRFGLALLYLLPAGVLARLCRAKFYFSPLFSAIFSLMVALLIDVFVVWGVILGTGAPVAVSTFMQFSANIIVLIVLKSVWFSDVWGNRFLLE